MDQGLETVISVLEKVVYPKINVGAFSHVMDYKSQLQELVQRGSAGMIEYSILEESGPAHNRQFISRVSLNDEELGIGNGRSKKEAEQKAAQKALEKLKQKLDAK